MEENKIYETETMDEFCDEVTDLVATDESSDDSEGGIGAGEIAIGGLALIGAGFLIKKAFDGGKWVYGKAKAGIESFKEKKAAKDAAKADAEVVADVEAEEVEEATVEEAPNKGKKK